MPEWGLLPIPKKILKRGIRDMVRISDSRMSGTAYGTCVLHVAPESYVGGPLALVRDGDMITLDIPIESWTCLSRKETGKTARRMDAAEEKDKRGYLALFIASMCPRPTKGATLIFFRPLRSFRGEI